MSGCSNIIINYVTNSTYLIWLGVRKKTEKLIKSRKLKKPNCEKKPIKSIKILKKLTFGFISLKLKKPNWTKKKPSQTGKNRVKLVWTGFCPRKPNRIEIGRFEPVSVLDIYIYIYLCYILARIKIQVWFSGSVLIGKVNHEPRMKLVLLFKRVWKYPGKNQSIYI